MYVSYCRSALTEFICRKIQDSGGSVIRLSGGDPALPAYLVFEAPGVDNVLGLLLPEKGIK
jgi:hypothetical protein